jgi:hypothetical protein
MTPSIHSAPPALEEIFPGDSELARLMRAFDWWNFAEESVAGRQEGIFG